MFWPINARPSAHNLPNHHTAASPSALHTAPSSSVALEPPQHAAISPRVLLMSSPGIPPALSLRHHSPKEPVSSHCRGELSPPSFPPCTTSSPPMCSLLPIPVVQSRPLHPTAATGEVAQGQRCHYLLLEAAPRPLSIAVYPPILTLSPHLPPACTCLCRSPRHCPRIAC